uniref:Collagen alpha-1(VIII) chain-like n=1 Tax=Crassostrea virginica TaxID=6565 RepID=A0A8B8AUE9_CRAVI|nr:collagen alpha-1(VIII) chain-like [Crassostrea virginica]
MGSTTNMAPFLKYLIFTAVCLLIGGSCGEHSLDRRANVVKRSDNDTYYNIYTKINTLEKYVSNLETKLQTRTKLLRQVLKSVLELDSNLGLPKKNLKKENIQASKKNAVGFTTKLPTTTYRSTSSIIRGSPILYNGGNAYNGTVFTCPSPGLYFFHVSLLSNTKDGGIYIYKNSQQLTLAYAGHYPQWNGASVSAATWLDVGDQVYLRPFSSSLYVDRNSAFTGVKIN